MREIDERFKLYSPEKGKEAKLFSYLCTKGKSEHDDEGKEDTIHYSGNDTLCSRI